MVASRRVVYELWAWTFSRGIKIHSFHDFVQMLPIESRYWSWTSFTLVVDLEEEWKEGTILLFTWNLQFFVVWSIYWLHIRVIQRWVECTIHIAQFWLQEYQVVEEEYRKAKIWSRLTCRYRSSERWAWNFVLCVRVRRKNYETLLAALFREGRQETWKLSTFCASIFEYCYLYVMKAYRASPRRWEARTRKTVILKKQWQWSGID